MASLTFRQRLRRVIYFFPFQLLALHLKKNHLLLICWLILFAYITSNLGVKYGIPNLFLYPEYFGRVGFWSFAITGFALGGFITAFNLYSYTMHGYRFPFLATIARPYFKFTVNNAIIPGLFILTYAIASAHTQVHVELVPPARVALNLAGFLTGIVSFLFLSLLYFTRTNTDITKLTGKPAEEYRPEEEPADILMPPLTPKVKQQQRRASRWLRREERTRKWQVDTYLTGRLRIKLARSSAHYDRALLRSVLWQNHINGSIFEVVVVVAFIALGAFSEVRFFAIPAGASAFLLFTMVLMLISALFSWMKGWTLTVLLALFIALDLISLHTSSFLFDNQAYGLDYVGRPASYTREHIAAMALDSAQADADALAMHGKLDRWKANQPGERPLMLIVNTSGGGSRAMLWTFRCLQAADSVLGGTLMARTALITGSSGGLIAATYFRQLYDASRTDASIDLQDARYLDDMAADVLNPVAFSFVTNDMFIRYRRVSDGRYLYTMDRGYAFERRLNEITHGVLDARMGELTGDPSKAPLPLLVISPTSINDGRRLLIASEPIAHLGQITPGVRTLADPQPESIDFARLFEEQDAARLELTSALRMSSTFPYITPVVTLPSEPPMRVMDAGIRDNYGYRTTLQFLYAFRHWIARNTRGVVILQIRDTQKDLEVLPRSNTIWERIFDPVGSVYGNFVKSQDQDYDLMLRLASGWADFPIDLADLQLRHDKQLAISLSWHLTALEKQHVLHTITSPGNQRVLEHLRDVAEGSVPMITQAGRAGGTSPALAVDRVPR